MKKKNYVVPEIELVEILGDDVMSNSSIIFPIRPMSLDPAEDLEY